MNFIKRFYRNSLECRSDSGIDPEDLKPRCQHILTSIKAEEPVDSRLSSCSMACSQVIALPTTNTRLTRHPMNQGDVLR